MIKKLRVENKSSFVNVTHSIGTPEGFGMSLSSWKSLSVLFCFRQKVIFPLEEWRNWNLSQSGIIFMLNNLSDNTWAIQWINYNNASQLSTAMCSPAWSNCLLSPADTWTGGSGWDGEPSQEMWIVWGVFRKALNGAGY